MLGKKGVYLLIILISSIILASCVGYIEISQLAIVTVTGIDLVGEKVLLTNEVIVPTDASGQKNDKGSSALYAQHEGDTIFEAIRNATLTLIGYCILIMNYTR